MSFADGLTIAPGTRSIDRKLAMSGNVSSSAESVLKEIRSTIASLESLRATAPGRRSDAGSPLPPARDDVLPSPLADPPVRVKNASQPTTVSAAAKAAASDGLRLMASVMIDDDEQPSVPAPSHPSVPVSHPSVRTGSSASFLTHRAVDKAAKIMIVDDEPLNVMTFRQHLKMEGYENFVTTSDALSSKRPYKEPFPRQKCFDILREGRGTQFDPAVIDAFFDCSDEIVEIQLLLMDEEDRIPKGEWEAVAQEAVKV